MALKEKIREYSPVIESEKLEQIADEFAIGFAEWVVWKKNFDKEVYHLNSYKELLEIYKKENGL